MNHIEPDHQHLRPPLPGGKLALITVIVGIFVLYFGRTILVPFALAVLFAFLLGPLVARLRRLGLGRVPSTIMVVTVAFLVVATLAGFMAVQMSDLARKLPEYRQNIRQKLNDIRSSSGGVITRITQGVHDLSNDLVPTAARQPAASATEEKPVPVEIREAPFSPLALFQKVLGSVLEVGLVAGIVVVFVIFMLIQREDLRDRFLRLLGTGRLNLTTTALDDAARRISRFLLAQFALNVAYGIPVGIGLYFIGVPNPILWALFAALLRYVPYLGIWIAAAAPAALAFAVDPGWIKVPLIFALFFGVDLLMYNFAEPLLYGSSTGISPTAILVASVFWTWLWGPVGLLLATPLTVCLVVIGRHVPSMEFLYILLSDTPVLRPETRFYQRMLALDLEEASQIASEYLRRSTLEDFFDSVAVPALTLAETDRHRGRLDPKQQKFFFENTQVLIQDLARRKSEINRRRLRDPQAEEQITAARTPTARNKEVLCIPARDQADEIAVSMLKELLTKQGIPARCLSAQSLAGEAASEVLRSNSKVVCITSVPPLGYMHTRYLCRRLRQQYPDLKLIAAVLNERGVEELRKRTPPLEADEIAVTLKQTLTAVIALTPTPTAAASVPAEA